MGKNKNRDRQRQARQSEPGTDQATAGSRESEARERPAQREFQESRGSGRQKRFGHN